MKWYEQLYLGESTVSRADEICRQLEAGTYSGRAWLILPSANGRDLFDLRPASDLRKAYFQNREVSVIGLAGGKREAVSLLPEIVTDYFSPDSALYRFCGSCVIHGQKSRES